MQVVAAGVHNRNGHAGLIDSRFPTPIWNVREFLDRQPVHICAQHDDGSWSVIDDSNDPSPADASRYLDPDPFQAIGDDVRRPVLMHRQFRVGM